MNSIEGLKILKKEYTEFNRSPLINLGCTFGLFNEDDFYRWIVTFLGPKDSLYKGGMFYLELKFPKDYPNNPPQINFLSPIFHPNVCPYKNSLGLVCHNFIKNWNPSYTVGFILTKLYALFYQVNPESAFDREIVNEYLFNRPLYESKVKFFTKKYASPMSNYHRNLDKDWNFSYFSYNEKDLTPFVKPKENNSEIYNEYDDNEKNIDVLFHINGSNIKIIIQCQLKEKIRDVVDRFLIKCSYKSKNELQLLYMYNSRKLNLDKQVGYEFINKSQVDVINITDLEFVR